MDLSKFLHKLIPHAQLARTDHNVSQIYQSVADNPFAEEGWKGYNGYYLAQPCQVSNPLVSLAKYIPPAYLQVESFTLIQGRIDKLLRESLPGNRKGFVHDQPSSLYSNASSVSKNIIVQPDQPAIPKVSLVDTNYLNTAHTLPPSVPELMVNITSNEEKIFFIQYKVLILNGDSSKLR